MSDAAKFCDQCGAAAAAAEDDKPSFRDQSAGASVTPLESSDAVRKTITVLFCDLVGSTGFGEAVDAEAAREAIGRYHAMAQATVDAHGGTVAKFIGDGVMAVFGVPEVGEDDADRAVATGLALQAGFDPIRQHIHDRYGFDVGLRVGINTGEVVIDEQDADIVGDALNTAARLESSCTPGRVLVGVDTWRLTRSTVQYEVLGEVTVRGRSGPVETFQVIDETPHEEDAAAPFVSREVELGELRSVYDRTVADRQAHIATVIGAPGVGKTRIAGELARACSEALHVDLRCERSGSATFAPVTELVRVTCGIDSDHRAADALAAIGTVVGESEVDRERVIDLLGSFVGATPARSTEETFFAVRRLLEVLGATRPVLLVVDDVQWAEPLFLDLLEHLVEWVNDAPVLIVALARPEIRELRAALTERGRRVSVVLSLEGLDASATEELAARLLGAESLPAELSALLPESTAGNPLFVRELVRMLVDDGIVVSTEDGWQMTVDAEAVEVPPTIQSLLAARVERMPPADRHFVELASVVGSEFPRGAVGAIVDAGTPSEIEATIERLRRRDVIEPTGSYWGNEPIYRFHHVLIRDAAYRRILKRTRADLHVRVGEWTEHTAGELVGEHEATIAFHYEQAHRCRTELDLLDDETTGIGERAAVLLHTAATRALERDDLGAAGGLARRALARLGSEAPSRRDLLLVACESLLGAGNVVEGQMVLDELDQLTADVRLEAWSACFHGQLINLSMPGELTFAEASVGAAAERLAQIDDQAGVAKARQTRAGTLARLGRVGECEAELDLALAAARAAADGRRVTAVLGSAPVAALWGPSPVPRAGGRCLDVIRLLRITTGSPAVEATAVRCQAVLEALRGRFDTARTMLASARRTAEELGLRHGLMETELYAGIVELLADRPTDAEPHLRVAYGGLGELGIGADAGQAGAHLARALLLQGRIDEAEEMADSSDALAGQNPQTLVAVRSVQAEIQAAHGNLDEAISLAEEAVALVARSDLIVDHAQAKLSLARVCAAAGNTAGEASALAEARRLFELKGAVVEFHMGSGERPNATRSSVDARDGGEALANVSDEFVEHITAPSAGEGRRSGRMLANRDMEVVLENMATRTGNRRAALFLAGDLDGLDQLTAPGFLADDRRTLMHSLASAPDLHHGVVGLVTDASSKIRAETLATRGELLAMVRARFEIDGFEIDYLSVESVDELGRQVRTVLFDVDALGPALDELNGLFLEGEGANHSDHLSGWFTMMSALNRGDVVAYAGAVPARFRCIDHRPMGWPDTDRDQFIELTTAPEVIGRGIMGIREIHRLSGLGAVATGFTFVDSTDAMAEPGWHYVALTRSGFDEGSVEYFTVDDLDTALARFDELAADEADRSSGDEPQLENEPWNEADRLVRRLIELFDDRSSDAWLEMLDPQIVAEDRDPLVDSTLVGREAHRAAWAREIGDRRLLSTVETVAVRGHRLALHRWRLSVDDGGLSWDLLRVSHWNDRDLADHSVGFAADDLAAAVAELDRLFLEETEASYVGDAFRVFSQAGATLSAGDVEGYLAYSGSSTVMVDHRQLGWPELDIDSLRPRLDSIVNMPGDFFFLLERFVRVDPTWAACWVQSIVFHLPDGVEQVQRSVMAMVTDDGRGQGSRTEQFEEDQVADALARLDELVAERGEQLVNRASMCWGASHALRRSGRADLVFDSFGSNGGFIDQRGEVMEPVIAERLETLAVRGELLALVELRSRATDDEPTRWFAVEEIDERGGLQSATTFPADKEGLTDAANLLEQRWQEIEGSSSVIRACGAWNRAHRSRDIDGIIQALQPDVLLIDHRPLGFPPLDRDAVVSMVGERDDVEHGVVLSERVVAVNDRGLVARVRQWRFDADDQMTMLIPSYCVATVRDNRVDRLEFFPDDDPAIAIARLDELTV